ncbi:MAG: DUF1295 domain-containing protein [Promethearchaeota archaeon]
MSNFKENRIISFIVVLISYLLAFFGAYFALNLMKNASFHPLIKILVTDIFATIIIYILSEILGNASLYDPYWSITPLIIGAYYLLNFSINNEYLPRIILIYGIVSIWGMRLTWNWVRGWKNLLQEDWRYRNFRKNYPKLFWFINLTGIQLLPTIFVYLGCLPLFFAFTDPIQPFNWLDILGIIISVGAILIETFSDAQMHSFVRLRKDKYAILDRKLWKFSRHPNYFGEVSFWWGIYCFGIAANPNSWWTIIGALAINLLFIFVSVPLMDKYQLTRKPEYLEYKNRTHALLPIQLSKK